MGTKSQAWEEAYARIRPEIEMVRTIIGSMDFSGGIVDDAQALYIAAQAMVPIVERANNEMKLLSSDDKLELAAQGVDDALKLPWYLEPLDKPVAKTLLSRIVAFLNKSTGAEASGVSFIRG